MNKHFIFSFLFYLLGSLLYVNSTIILSIETYDYFTPFINGIVTMLVVPISLFIVFWSLDNQLRRRLSVTVNSPFQVLIIVLCLCPIFFNALGFGDYWRIRDQRVLLSHDQVDLQTEDFTDVSVIRFKNATLSQKHYGFHRKESSRRINETSTTIEHDQIVVPIIIDGARTRFFAQESYTDAKRYKILHDTFDPEKTIGWVVHDPYVLKTCLKAFNHYEKNHSKVSNDPVFLTLSRKSYAEDLKTKMADFVLYLSVLNGLAICIVLYLSMRGFQATKTV